MNFERDAYDPSVRFRPSQAPSRTPPRAKARGGEEASTRAARASPTVAEGHVVLDFFEVGVAFAELDADALDGRSDIRTIAMVSAAGDETFVVHAVVDRAVSHVTTGVRRQQFDDVVLPDREADIDVIPIGAADVRPEHKAAADDRLVSRHRSGRPCRFQGAPQPPVEYV